MGYVPALVPLFIAFIAITSFAVMNVVTGVFCQSVIESANQDKDLAAMQHLSQMEFYMDFMRTLFDDMDINQSGVITINDLEASLHDERMHATFGVLELEVSDAWTLFKILDRDATGVISMDEFIKGCLQLRGSAKGVHLAQIAYDNKLSRIELRYLIHNLSEQVELLLRQSKGYRPTARGDERNGSLRTSLDQDGPAETLDI